MSLGIIKYTLGSLNSNCFVLFDKKSLEAIIIDIGDSPEYLIEELTRKNLKAKACLATHAHFDHILGAFYLQLVLKIPFFMSKKDEFLLNE